MIKGIILDVDGVIVGEKVGFNSPYPNDHVIQRLKEIRNNGIVVSLCTAKPHISVQNIIEMANLRNLHISNGGSVVIDPIDNIILNKHVIDLMTAKEVIKTCIDFDIYVEFYTVNNYFVQKNQINSLTETHSFVLQSKPVIVENLVSAAELEEIVKIMPVAKNIDHKTEIIKILEPIMDGLSLSWGTHPIALPHQFGIITTKDISKKQAADEIANKYNIKHEELLGIGDSTSDWQFMEMCGHVGAMGNATDELKRLVSSKSEKHFFIGRSVDENGILDIFDYFLK